MKLFRWCLVGFIYLMNANFIDATHIVGGELTYRCLGNNTFEISLTVFRDCENGVPYFDNPASIGVFDTANNYITQLLIPQSGDDTLNPVLFNPCLVIPPNVCVHRTTYIDTVNIPFLAGGYQLAYQRCCRNNTITNIINPNITGATYYTLLTETALTSCNSSAVFNAWPPVYICAGEPIVFDHSATDLDGDSLVYELCAPFNGATPPGTPIPQPPNPPPYDSINWIFPFSTSNMMGGTPLSIDRQTGLLTGTPVTTGQYVVGVCVKEYRNGQLISTTRRDFQYNVGQCAQVNTSSFFVPSLLCDSSLTVNFQNFSQGSSNLLWSFNDPNSNMDTSTIFSPTYTYSDSGVYSVSLVVGVGELCADTFTQTISVQYESLRANFSVVYDECVDSTVAQFIDQSTDDLSQIISWNWDFYDGNTSTAQDTAYLLQGQSSYDIRLIVTAANGCQDFAIQTLPVYPAEVKMSSGTQLCRGSEVQLFATGLDSTDQLSYLWLPDEAVLNGQNTNSVIVAPVHPTTFYVQATNQYGCTGVDSIFFPISPNAPLLTATVDKNYIFPGEKIQLLATLNPDYTYTWSPDTMVNNFMIHNPTATPFTSVTFLVRVVDKNGCVNLDTVNITIRPFECDDPFIFIPNAFTPNDDGQNDKLFVRANAITEIYFAVYNRWGEKVFETEDLNTGWDGTFKGEPLSAEVFGYYLRVRCFNGQVYFKKGNVALIR